MKKIILLFAALACVLSCEKDQTSKGLELELEGHDPEMVEENNHSAKDDINNLLKFMTEENDLSLEETEYLNNEIQEIQSEVSDDGYRKIVINYPSVDTKGAPATLSGAIFLPKNSTVFNKILLYCHQTTTSNGGAPTGSSSMCYEPLIVTKDASCVCFASDYLGFGTSKQYTHPYMNNALAARNEIDMMKAGIAYLQNNGYTIRSAEEGLQTYIFGYSQGGGVALATHKALETDKQLCKDLNFCGSLCGDGPYNLRTTFKKFLDDKVMIMPFLLPYVLLGMYESYPEDFAGINIYDYMSDKCKKAGVIEYIKSKPGLTDILTWAPMNIGVSTTGILSDSAKDLNGKLMTTLYNALDKQNLLDGSWTPEYPVVFYHSEKDNIVAYGNASEALKVFPTNICRRSSKDDNMGHMLEYVHFTKIVISKGFPAMINN